MTVVPGSKDHSVSADLLARAVRALTASERRSDILGPLAANEAPWALLVSTYIEQFGIVLGAAEVGRVKPDRMAPNRVRWTAVLEDLGLISRSSNGGVLITERGKGAVEQCLDE